MLDTVLVRIPITKCLTGTGHSRHGQQAQIQRDETESKESREKGHSQARSFEVGCLLRVSLLTLHNRTSATSNMR